jgi:hypothetical protein
MNEPSFDAPKIVEILERHRVDYVLVGGFAAVLYGARRPTEDIDIAPAMTAENLHRLSEALRELKATIRVDDLLEGLAFDTSADALRGMSMLNLRTAYGDCDLTFAPAGFRRGYDDLIAASHERRIGRVTVKVAALDDIIRSKASANRPKDHEALPELEALSRRLHHSTEPQAPTIEL